MPCQKCGAPTPKRLCPTHRVEANWEGVERDDLGWFHEEDDDE